MSEPLLTRGEKATLLKAGLGLGAVVWAGPQLLGMLFVLLFLGLFATVAVFALAGTLLKYGLIAVLGITALGVVARLLGGPARKAKPLSPERAAAKQQRLQKAKLDLELAKAQAAASARKT